MQHSIVLLVLAVSTVFASVADSQYVLATAEKIVDPSCVAKKSPWVIVRGSLSTGMVDRNLVENAKALEALDVPWASYIFPCFSCGSPVKQLQDLKKAIEGFNRHDIVAVIVPQGWSTDQAKNREFLVNMVHEAFSLGLNVIFGTNKFYYEQVVGESWSYIADIDIPLIYFDADKNPSCSDFKKFCGWPEASLKGFDVDQKVCGNTFDLLSYCREQSLMLTLH
eukprot:TRINITY_DN88857_c0_g1_i1.p1 TRINITY_DN88857_c0_g1~~TRINITY_DN88857_c0_g1_i1.p1  ORF type:complete len:223 (+),score=12.05 TRINITY_DN88857_c0_g1_i1:130-798(+)